MDFFISDVCELEVSGNSSNLNLNSRFLVFLSFLLNWRQVDVLHDGCPALFPKTISHLNDRVSLPLQGRAKRELDPDEVLGSSVLMGEAENKINHSHSAQPEEEEEKEKNSLKLVYWFYEARWFILDHFNMNVFPFKGYFWIF